VSASTEYVQARLAEWDQSPDKARIELGRRYHHGHNDILERERYVLGRKGEKLVPQHLGQTKLPHNFFRKLVRQKIGYLLGRPVGYSTDSDVLSEAIGLSFDKRFYRALKAAATDGVVAGIGWLGVYLDEAGVPRVRRMPTQDVVPIWTDRDHVDLAEIIYRYIEITYDGAEKIQTTRIRHSIAGEGTYLYHVGDGDIVPDDDPWEPDFWTSGDEPGVWERVPFIPIRYNPAETSLLSMVKPLIDDYDLNTSDLSNELQDEPNALKVVANYDGSNKEEFIHNMAVYSTVFVREGGSVTGVGTKIDSAARDAHLDRLRSDIYELGSGVDTQVKSLGNSSGVALRFVYSDLDTDCDEFGTEVSLGLDQLLWFIQQAVEMQTGEDVSDERVDWVFDTDSVINEQEKISSLKDSAGLISQRTILEQHPYVSDPDDEEERLTEERRLVLDGE